MGRNGFTLLELLVILAIVGLLMGLIGWASVRSIRSAELREAATQLATDLRRARSQAQRGSANMTVELPGSGGGTTYRVGTQVKDVPNSVTVLCKTTCGTGTKVNVTYQAPHGELAATGNVFTIKSPLAALPPLEVRVVGVTGKVILAQGVP